MEWSQQPATGTRRMHTLTIDREQAEALMLVLEAGFDALIARTAAAAGSDAGAAARERVLAHLETAEGMLDELEDAFEPAH